MQLQKEIGMRQQIDSALRESEERFRILIEKAPEAILLFDVDRNRYIEANAKAGELFGCSHPNLLEHGPQQFYLPDQDDKRPVGETIREHRDQVLDGAELVFERRIRNARGEDQVVEVRLVRLPSSTKKLIRSSFIDITERKKVNEALRQSEERYRGIVEHDYRVMLENIQDVFYRTDAAGNLILVTPSGAALLGYEGIEAAIGKPVTDFYADPAQRDNLLAALKKDGSVFNLETTLKRKDGSRIIVSTSSHRYYDVCGNYAGVEGIFRDITRFKRVQAELRQSEELYRVLVGHIQDGAFLMQDGLLLFCNEAFAGIIGYTPDAIIGNAVSDLIAPEDRDLVMERQRNRLAGRSLEEVYEFRMFHKDGVTRVPVHLSVGTGTYKNRPAVMGTVRDLTKERPH
jgi:PAS domain S-box-containing protein